MRSEGYARPEGLAVGLSGLGLLAALALGISHAPAQPVGCTTVIPVLAVAPPPVMAGNMRTTDGACLVWLNLTYAGLRRRDVCQLASHEAGHLANLPHSPDPFDVMYSPFTPLRRNYCKG